MSKAILPPCPGDTSQRSRRRLPCLRRRRRHDRPRRRGGNPSPWPTRPVIERLLRERTAVARLTGTVHNLFPVAVGPAEGEGLREWVQRESATRTIEIGVGYGIAALFVCEGLLANRDTAVRHVALDPYQEPRFASSALQFLDEAGGRRARGVPPGGIGDRSLPPSRRALPCLLTEQPLGSSRASKALHAASNGRTPMSIVEPLMFQGLPPSGSLPYPWQRILRDRLSYQFQRLRPQRKTEQAEDGLGYSRSAYWYVCRSDAAFGRLGALWSLAAPPASRTATGVPFDTGDLWHGEIHVSPAFTDALDKASFVNSVECLATDLLRDFESWLAKAYPSSAISYLDGLIPATHVPRITLTDVNKAHAWTWELRVDVDADLPTIIRLVRIFWSEAEFEEFEVWMQRNDDAFSTGERDGFLSTCHDLSVFTNEPVGTVRDHLEACLGR